MRAFAISLSGNGDRADDLVQETLLRAIANIDSFQPGYHLMRRDIEDGELPWCARHDVGVIAYGPLAHGLL
ncbi:MAG: hypothetical protein DI543_27225, partial [Bradyrhizobium icense]